MSNITLTYERGSYFAQKDLSPGEKYQQSSFVVNTRTIMDNEGPTVKAYNIERVLIYCKHFTWAELERQRLSVTVQAGLIDCS